MVRQHYRLIHVRKTAQQIGDILKSHCSVLHILVASHCWDEKQLQCAEFVSGGTGTRTLSKCMKRVRDANSTFDYPLVLETKFRKRFPTGTILAVLQIGISVLPYYQSQLDCSPVTTRQAQIVEHINHFISSHCLKLQSSLPIKELKSACSVDLCCKISWARVGDLRFKEHGSRFGRTLPIITTSSPSISTPH